LAIIGLEIDLVGCPRNGDRFLDRPLGRPDSRGRGTPVNTLLASDAVTMLAGA
jgi:hypothetical protein